MWKNIYIRRLGYTFPVIWEILRAGLQVSLGDFNMGRHFQKRAKLKVVTRHYDPCVYGNKGHNGVQKIQFGPFLYVATYTCIFSPPYPCSILVGPNFTQFLFHNEEIIPNPFRRYQSFQTMYFPHVFVRFELSKTII